MAACLKALEHLGEPAPPTASHVPTQGSLRAYIPANNVTKKGPKLMERGEVGWAGGGPGPDFFIYLGAQPAAHFGLSHTVWGEVADDQQSFDTVEAIVKLPAPAPTPQSMHMLSQEVEFTTGGT